MNVLRALWEVIASGANLLRFRFDDWARDLDRRSRGGQFGKWPWQERPGLWPWQRR